VTYFITVVNTASFERAGIHGRKFGGERYKEKRAARESTH